MFISPAYAQGLGGGTSGIVQLAPLILIFVVFYFFLIRPQQTKAKQHKAVLDALRRGDRVVTGGGIIGMVSKVVSDQEVQVDIADGVRVRVLRSTIASVIAKTEPVAAAKEPARDRDRGKERDTAGDKAKEGEEIAAAKTPEPAEAGAGGDVADRIKSGLRRLIGR